MYETSLKCLRRSSAYKSSSKNSGGNVLSFTENHRNKVKSQFCLLPANSCAEFMYKNGPNLHIFFNITDFFLCAATPVCKTW